MRRIDKLIRFKLAKKAKGVKLEPGLECPSDLFLSKYVSGTLEREKRETIESHIAQCFLCLDKIVSAYEGGKLLEKRKLKTPSKQMIWKAKNVERIDDSLIKERIDLALDRNKLLPRTQKLLAVEKSVINWLPKKLRKNKWLIGSITAFVLSFAFPVVFLQFLIAAGILGGKWIFDSENAKTLIMVYNAWKRGGEKEADEMLKALKNRLPYKK